MTRSDRLWVIGWAVASSLYCVTTARQLSATFDEPLYLARGLERWRTGSHAGLLRGGTMPLAIDLQTLPLFAYERWRGAPLDPSTDLARVLPWARAVTLAFWWLLLAYGWRAGRALAGRRGGRLAVAWLACEPSLLAHASLATTDLAVSACLLALCCHFRAGRAAGWLGRCAVPAAWCAAAVLAKASALTIAPLCLLAIELERRWSSRAPTTGARAFGRDLAWILASALVLVFLYCGSDWNVEPSFVAWAHDLHEQSSWRPLMVWLAEHLRIFRNAGEAIVRQGRHNLRGHGVFLLGTAHPRALWYYFPVLMTIKLSEPLVLAWGLALVASRRRANWPLWSATLLLLYSLTFRVQLGIRLVLPLVVLALVGSAVGLARVAATADRSWRGRLVRSLPVLVVAWTAWAATTAWPQGLAYVNGFWGGSLDGYRLVSDSNYDWGQGLRELRQWAEQRGVGAIDVWYFGTDPAVHAPPLQLLPLHILPIQEPDDVRAHVRGVYLAASTTLLYGTAGSDAHRNAAAFLRAQPPAARTTTFLIYDFRSPPP